MDRRSIAVVLFAFACSSGDAPANQAAATARDSSDGTAAAANGTTAATASGTAAVAGASADVGGSAQATGGGRAPNLQGRIPVLEYHVIGGDKNTLYTRTAASYRADLETAYKMGYRPITIAQMLDKDFRDVPAGMSPVVIVFDDASDSQFRYLEKNGNLEIDPTSAIGIWMDFAKTHPGWKNRAVFCMLNGGAVGHNFFGDNPKWGGQKKEWRHQKVKWLADQGFELCSHTLWHAKLNKYSDAVVQEQIARNVMGIDSAVAGYKVRTMALPYGIWPKNRPLAWQGSWTDPKSGKTHSYKFDAVLEVAGGPARSPYDPQFNPKSINRIEAIGDDIVKALERLDKNGSRFVPGAK
jgi:hypothetical protein